MAGSELSELELHLVALDLPPERTDELAETLSATELSYAARLARPDRWRTARGWLRRVLAHRLGADPHGLVFTTDAGGKPRLDGVPLHFSIARSDGVALIATGATPLGVDVEAVRPVAARQATARRFFTGAEERALAVLPAARRDRAFLECWTRKEAYGKAIGAGLHYPTSEVEVWVADGAAVWVPGWRVSQLDVGPGLVAALAVGGETEPVARFGGGWYPSSTSGGWDNGEVDG